jgi:hypothetical protein
MGLITGLAVLVMQRYISADAVHQLLTFNPADFFTCASPLSAPPLYHFCPTSTAVFLLVHIDVSSGTLWCLPCFPCFQSLTVYRTRHYLQRVDIVWTCRYLLPPIIFYAGLSVKKKQFFRNFSSITLFGVVGTYVAFAVIASTLFVVSKLPGNSLETLVSFISDRDHQQHPIDIL